MSEAMLGSAYQTVSLNMTLNQFLDVSLHQFAGRAGEADGSVVAWVRFGSFLEDWRNIRVPPVIRDAPFFH